MSIRQNIEEFYAALKAVKDHCMAARVEDDGQKVTITYPEGIFGAHGNEGIRVERNAVLLRRALTLMEHDWLSSFPNGRP